MGRNSPEESMDICEKVVTQDGDVVSPSSSSMAVDLQNQVKKPTRQWAAWTRQEEENFFNALRQVGKNFEKITCRVQSKNKDQVRHYYYRLIRRMNKLLGPEFCLDAKNSKDTIAAMLRWWSLLEKYSCTASKLHLKPRRFKTFIEALAHQLLKDRNKTRRKRSYQDENNSFIPPTSASIVTRGYGNDVNPMELLLLENQKTQKVGYTTKSSSFKGNNMSPNNHCGKGGFTIAKSMKQGRRTGLMASAAYRRWEKAALAGVSLVADAAEQLERTATDTKVSSNKEAFNALPPKDCTQEHNAGSTTNLMSSPLSSGIQPSHHREVPVQPSTKLKLQLFPMDDITRKALEKDEHNPHLELTLSARKRISSIIEHLHSKWGKSSVASGELMLFPYSIQADNVINCQRWTLRDKRACAADVYLTVGQPSIFRLRYGWLSSSEPELINSQLPSPSGHRANNMQSRGGPEGNGDKFVLDEKTTSKVQKDNSLDVANVELHISSGVQDVQIANISPRNIILESLQTTVNPSRLEKESRNEKEQNHEETLRSENSCVLFAGDWADSLTNISIGDLLSEASGAADSTCNNHCESESALPVQSSPFSSDSFDAAIAAHVSGYKGLQSTSNQVSHASIWDGEETCDEFSFERNASCNRKDSDGFRKTSSASTNQMLRTTFGSHGPIKETQNDNEAERAETICHDGPGLDTKSQSGEGDSDGNCDNEKTIGLTDVYWPDSLGADLEIPSFQRYVGQDMILVDSDSLGGLSRLIANSFDVFQNLSCVSEKRTPSANVLTSVSSGE